jgi:hypothetical protein
MKWKIKCEDGIEEWLQKYKNTSHDCLSLGEIENNI